MKLTMDDLKIRSRNKQVIDKLEERFGSLDSFADTIELSRRTVSQYLKQNKEYTDRFKAELTRYLGDYNSLGKSPEEQTEEYIETLTRDIYSYRDEADSMVLEKALQMAIEYKLSKSTAKAYRNMGMYHLNRAAYGYSLTFYKLALTVSQQVEDINIECMIISEMIAVYTHMSRLKEGEKLFLKYENKFETAEPYRKYWYYYYAAVLYINDENYSYARPVLKKAMADADTNYIKSRCLNLFGFCDKKEKKYESALSYYSQALELAEQNRERIIEYNNIADLYNAMGNRRLAEENIEKAMGYIRLNTINEHLRAYQTYVEIKDTDQSVSQLLGVMESLITSKRFYPAYVLESINFIISKGVRIERVESIIVRYIESSEENTSFTDKLYRFLGVVRFMEVKNRGKD